MQKITYGKIIYHKIFKTMKKFNDDSPIYHWPNQYLNVKNKIVLDLGCGNIGQLDTLSFPSTPEHLINNGAKQVIALDTNQSDIQYLKSKINSSIGVFLHESLNSSEQLKNLISKYNINAIKSDCEGGEIFIFSLDDETFKLIDEYYIETQNPMLHALAMQKLNSCGYKIKEILEFEALPGQILVIFACKIN